MFIGWAQREELRRQKFDNDNAIRDTTQKWLRKHSKSLYEMNACALILR